MGGGAPPAQRARRARPAVTELELEHLTDRYELIRHGGAGAATLVCGAVRFDHPAARNLVRILPATIHIDGADARRASWMHEVFKLMAAEARELGPAGTSACLRARSSARRRAA